MTGSQNIAPPLRHKKRGALSSFPISLDVYSFFSQRAKLSKVISRFKKVADIKGRENKGLTGSYARKLNPGTQTFVFYRNILGMARGCIFMKILRPRAAFRLVRNTLPPLRAKRVLSRGDSEDVCESGCCVGVVFCSSRKRRIEAITSRVEYWPSSKYIIPRFGR